MIINIRGTSGSGKTTLARRIMEHYPTKSTFRIDGRRQPIGYLYHRPGGRSLAVVGHYETVCGGCDTISKADDTFRYVMDSAKAGHDVLFEGLLISADVNRILALKEAGLPVRVVALDVPLEVCLDSVNQRRRAKNPDKPDVNPKNTASKHKAVELSLKRLREAGVECGTLDREEAYRYICRTLGL